MELFVNSLEDEILFELEGANFDIDINEEKIIRLIRNGSFPHLSYFYNGLDLKEFLLKNPFYFSGESNFFRSQKQVGEFVFR
ncbi:MAG: hypothetical protein KC550_04950, partial [Nanoarchaeota archaeon]|nr:hypothetical protein [Nanoarchaeota archaeon]